MGARQLCLEKARSGRLVSDRADYLVGLAAGKRILDVGVVDHSMSAMDGDNWLHGKLCKVAAECHGVDVLPEAVTALQKRGYSVSCVDITEQPLSSRFEMVVCGEVIEHIGQTAKFLNSIRSMLVDRGTLVLTTPNPWFINVMMKAAFGAHPYQDNADHVAWYDPSTLYELGGRSRLELIKYSGVAVVGPRTVRSRFLFGLSKVLIRCGVRCEIFAKSMIYEFVAV